MEKLKSRRKANLTTEEINEILELRAQKVSVKEICETYNIKSSIAYSLKKEQKKPKSQNILSITVGNIVCNIECENTKVSGVVIKDDSLNIKVSSI